MKRIAIFCDGTWNRSDAKHPTNVVRLAQSVCHKAKDKVEQFVIYVEGVGAGRGSSRRARRLDRIGGGAFGWGLTENVAEAYRHLAFNFEPGDQLFVFGFSRGAYTARSLAGLIRSCGVPAIDNVPRIPEAISWYRNPAGWTHPRSDESKRFRSWFSPAVATQPDEPEWRLSNDLGSCSPLQIAYLGVWDTVGALGVPGHYRVLARIFNRQHEFHDAELSSMVAAARHAVAIDERRRTFPPTLWNNIGDLNGGQTGDARRYRQEWFPGDHGSIGGGGDIRGLANAAMIWVAEGAEQEGLAFAGGALEPIRSAIDPSAPLRSKSTAPGLLERALMLSAADREGPSDPTDVSATARGRWDLPSPPLYRPKPLGRVMT